MVVQLDLVEVEFSLDIEEYVGLAAAHCLKVRFAYRAVVEVIPCLGQEVVNKKEVVNMAGKTRSVGMYLLEHSPYPSRRFPSKPFHRKKYD
jgi:hypothetical protein